MLEVKIRNIVFKNPILTASGTFGYGLECPELTDVSKLGAVVTKSVSRKLRHGNPFQRIAESTGGMLNSIGLANVGIDIFLNEKIPALKVANATVLVNIAASSIEEYCYLIERCEELNDGVAGYEINVSCPNVKDGGLNFGTNCNSVGEITKSVRKLTDKFISIKLTPNVTSVSEFAIVCESEGADAVTCCNTFLGMAIDSKSRKPKLATITGGYSGPAIKPMALAKVYEVRKATKIPIIGSGGIMCVEDALEFLIVGASLIELGTALFVDPNLGSKIIIGIEDYLIANSFESVNDLIGSLDTTMQPSLVASGWS